MHNSFFFLRFLQHNRKGANDFFKTFFINHSLNIAKKFDHKMNKYTLTIKINLIMIRDIYEKSL